MGEIPDSRISAVRECIAALKIECAPDAAEKLCRYQALLEDWNTRMNLTGDAAFETVLDRHISDCLAALQVPEAFPANARVIDVGSGAGFPGMVLAIARPDLRFTLLDSLNKRITFLDAVIQELGLANVETLHARSEDAARDIKLREKFDIAAARAVSSLPVLYELLLPFVRIGGKTVCYKGPAAEEELPPAKKAAALLGGGVPRTVPVILPQHPDWGHCVVLCEKLAATQKKYPRKAGTPAASPLGL